MFHGDLVTAFKHIEGQPIVFVCSHIPKELQQAGLTQSSMGDSPLSGLPSRTLCG